MPRRVRSLPQTSHPGSSPGGWPIHRGPRSQRTPFRLRGDHCSYAQFAERCFSALKPRGTRALAWDPWHHKEENGVRRGILSGSDQNFRIRTYRAPSAVEYRSKRAARQQRLHLPLATPSVSRTAFTPGGSSAEQKTPSCQARIPAGIRVTEASTLFFRTCGNDVLKGVGVALWSSRPCGAVWSGF